MTRLTQKPFLHPFCGEGMAFFVRPWLRLENNGGAASDLKEFGTILFLEEACVC